MQKIINEIQNTKCKKYVQCKYIQKVNNEPLYLAGLQFHLIDRFLQLLDWKPVRAPNMI